MPATQSCRPRGGGGRAGCRKFPRENASGCRPLASRAARSTRCGDSLARKCWGTRAARKPFWTTGSERFVQPRWAH